MKESYKYLIAALCRNNIEQAKEFARKELETDKAQKDARFCSQMIELLDSAELSRFEVPANIQGLIAIENVADTFNQERYYLSSREQKLTEDILKVNKASEKLSDLGINYVNSTMLHGESGTGKTTFGRYLAYRLDIPFAYMTFSKLIDSKLGQTLKNVNSVFEFIKNQKCVFMIDEIDAIGKKRGADQEVGEMARIVISLMQNLDELANGVVLLGATNRLDVLDEAVLRRFSLKHEVTRLEKTERLKMVSRYLDGVTGYNLSTDDIIELADPDGTQADLLHRIVMRMVHDFSEKLPNINQTELF